MRKQCFIQCRRGSTQKTVKLFDCLVQSFSMQTVSATISKTNLYRNRSKENFHFVINGNGYGGFGDTGLPGAQQIGDLPCNFGNSTRIRRTHSTLARSYRHATAIHRQTDRRSGTSAVVMEVRRVATRLRAQISLV